MQDHEAVLLSKPGNYDVEHSSMYVDHITRRIEGPGVAGPGSVADDVDDLQDLVWANILPMLLWLLVLLLLLLLFLLLLYVLLLLLPLL